jgi:hypothetical protein
MDLAQCRRLAGKFLELELADGFRGTVWLNAIDSTWSDHELNFDVISVESWGTRSEILGDGPMIVAASAVVRADIVPEAD